MAISVTNQQITTKMMNGGRLNETERMICNINEERKYNK